MDGGNSVGGSIILLVLIVIILGAGILGASYHTLSQDYTQLQKSHTAAKEALNAAEKQAQKANADLAAARQEVKELKSQVAGLKDALRTIEEQVAQQDRTIAELQAKAGAPSDPADYHDIPPQPRQVEEIGMQPALSSNVFIPNTGKPVVSGFLPEQISLTAIAAFLACMGLGGGSFLVIRRQAKANASQRETKVALKVTREQLRDYLRYQRRCSSASRTQPVKVR